MTKLGLCYISTLKQIDYWELKFPCEKFKRKDKEAEDLLELCLHQHVEMERCESKELDVEIRNLIERSGTSKMHEDPEPIAQGSLNHQRTLCSLKISDMLLFPVPAIVLTRTSFLQSKHVLSNKEKTALAKSQERHILSLERQRQELLDVNKQWDRQFRIMKQLYEKQLAEVKAKLHISERRVSELEEERHQRVPEERLQVLDRDRPSQETKESKVLSETLHEMKEENKLLKQKNASMIRKQEHYECEISRLNKVLLDVLKKKNLSVLGTPSETGDKSSLDDMRTQLEVLKQQVQIYEEDFRKERSDRERLNEEKEALQKANERLQTQLNKLNIQV
ncbi:hypothetical protein ASZ78_012480 [Callipepla squamata]|uniref:NF-kappa-B essential modulator NEMO CC2-LZ domain-containing protein n=1 Tax=Callipepla squamata TaxID=9009 RepID=A0A226MW45_CALSU|nr:hypothetical protein ASZ78_012480 [Callipepla squamata]